MNKPSPATPLSGGAISTRPGSTFGRLDAMPAYRQVFNAIENLIMSGELKTGDLLPTETELANQFGINRSTLREGIRLLEHGGLVRRKTAKRLEVSLPLIGELASRTGRALRLHQVTFRELWETAVAIEPVVCRYAAQRIGNRDIEQLEQNLTRMEQASESTEELVRLDIEFHDIIARASGNRALDLAREPISLLFRPAGLAILPRLHTEKRIIDAHRLILSALRHHETQIAENWMRKHIEDFRRGFERIGLDLDQPLENI